jgi:alanyl-tRNA synthetase
MELFWKDPYRSTITTRVLERRITDTGVALRLEDHLFYPESGGQPDDHGTIGGIELLRLEREGDRLWHHLSRAPAGDRVELVLDTARRRDHMQQHLGQHILSRAFEVLAGAQTIGFHMGERTTTIDLDRELTDEEIAAAEGWSNRIIDEHHEVVAFFPSQEELEDLNLRKEPGAHDKVRIVRIEGVDEAACGGTHPANTSEVGLIKIIKSERYKGGLRISFLCGGRARRHYAYVHELLQSLSSYLGTGTDSLLPRVENLMSELSDVKKQRDTLLESERERLIGELGTLLSNTGRLIRSFEEGPDFYRPIAATLTTQHEGVVLFFSPAAEDFHFLLASDASSADTLQHVYEKLGQLTTVKGGGHRTMKQGLLGGIDAETLLQLF